MNFADIDLDTIDPYNCGLSPEAAKKFAVQIEIMRVLKKNYPGCLKGPDPKDVSDALNCVAMITGVLLAGVCTQRNEATFKYVAVAYLRKLADNTMEISKQASNILRDLTKEAQKG